MTLNGDGHNVTVGSPSGQAIAVNESAATDVVNLIGLNVNGFGTGVEGVSYLGGGTLRIENSDIYGFTAYGVVDTTSGAALEIDGSSIHGNGAGVYDNPDGGHVVIDNSSEGNSGDGLYGLNSGGQVVIDDSQIDENGGYRV